MACYEEGNINLLKAAQALRDAHASGLILDMQHYVRKAGQTYFRSEDDEEDWDSGGSYVAPAVPGLEEGFCLTPSCVIGHYAFRSDLQSLLTVKNVTPQSLGGVKYADDGGTVDYDDGRVLQHFEITNAQAIRLFGRRGCGGATEPLSAAEYIEAFVTQRMKDCDEGKYQPTVEDEVEWDDDIPF